MTEPIGRQAECASLTTFLDALAEGRGGLLLLEGEGGTGKTTLAEWAMHDASTRGFVALTGRSWEMSQSVPYEPIVAVLGRFLRTQPDDIRRELTVGLSSLATLIDGLEIAQPVEGIGDISRARLHDAVATLLARVATTQPVVFLIDDLHWCDVSSLELLQFLSRDLPHVALGILATVRPGDADDRPDVRSFLAPLRRASFCSSVTVRNLDRDQTVQLLADRLGGEPPDRLVELVWSRSIGTPLLVHEMVEDLRSRGVLVETERGWTITDPDPPLPRVAADLIHDRIERAEPTERSLLEILAVADEPTPLEVLVAVSEVGHDEVVLRLGRLIAKRLVAEVIDPRGDVMWHAEHPIIGHVVAEELDELVRQRLHRKLLAASPDAPVARRARHVVGGGPPIDPIEAVDILIEAGETAFRQGAAMQALANFEAAESIAEALNARVDGDAAADAERSEGLGMGPGGAIYRVRIGKGRALTRLRRSVEAVHELEAAWGHAVEAGDATAQLSTLALLDTCLFLAGEPIDLILERLDGLEHHLEAAEDWDALTEAHFYRFTATGRNGQTVTGQLSNALGQIGDRPLGPRAHRIRELLEISRQLDGDRFDGVDPLIAHLVDIAQGDGDWDLRRRASLMATDLACHVGIPGLVDQAITCARAVEVEIGERPNWRIPIQRAITALNEGQELGDFHDLMQVGQVDRAHALIALVRSLEYRFRHGPDAAVVFFDQLRPRAVTDDPVAALYDRFGRVLISEGSEHEPELAQQAAGRRQTADLATLFTFPYLGYAAVLTSTLVGPDDATDAGIARMHRSTRGSDLPSAWQALSAARRETDRRRRAELLVEAADCLDACGYRLEAASRLIEAAETDADVVDAERLIEAGRFVSTCGAGWLSGRAAALVPGLSAVPELAAEDGLTKREWEVAGQVAKGLTNREVAQELFISIRTVTSHLDHIYTKLGFSSRDDLADYVAGRLLPNT